MPVKIGYWSLRGLGNHIRYLLEYAEEDYKEVRYEWTTSGPNEWFDVKFKSGLDFPNLPWMEDEDIKISQSGAIIRYLAEKHGLHGKDPKERATLEMLEAEAHDFHTALAMVVYNPDFDNMKDGLHSSQKTKLEQLESFLGEKKFFGGETPKLPDFHLYEVITIHTTFYFPDDKEKFPKLMAFLQRFEELPKIKAYQASDKFIAKPFFGPAAKWDLK